MSTLLEILLPAIEQGQRTFDTAADKWKEWAIGIVRDAQRELYGY